jgi:hypothetical protein
LDEICDELDQRETRSAEDQRRFPRYPWRSDKLIAYLRQGAHDVPCQIFSRNISEGGMSLLNGFMIPAGQTIRIRVPIRHGIHRDISARVCHCRRIEKSIYEFGIRYVASGMGREMLNALLLSGGLVLKSFRTKEV